MTGTPAFADADGFAPTEDPRVRVSLHLPHALCDVFGHQWHVFPHPMAMVFNPENGAHLFSTFHVMCRRCPVRCLVERRPGEDPPSAPPV